MVFNWALLLQQQLVFPRNALVQRLISACFPFLETPLAAKSNLHLLNHNYADFYDTVSVLRVSSYQVVSGFTDRRLWAARRR